MKKLLIMSMALFFSIPIFAQTKTVKSNSAAVDEIKQKFNAVKNEAAEVIKKETGTKNGRVTRPSRPSASQEETSRPTLTLLDRPTQSGVKTPVTRPSRPSASQEETSRPTLTLLDRPTQSGVKTPVTRPSRPSVSSENTRLTDTLLGDKPTGRTVDKTNISRPHPRGGKPRR